VRNANRIEVADALNIQSLKHLYLQTGIAKEEIISVATNIKDHFRTTEIRQTKPNGKVKVREIYLPSPRLEAILQAVNIYLLRKIRLSEAVHGSRKGRSPLTNAMVHIGKKYLLGLDIEKFFPSIKPHAVFNMFRRLNCSPTVAKHLTWLCTADNHVPQGYATSPAIANLVLIPITERIHGLVKKQGIKFGTFVDDITLSGNRSLRPFQRTVEKIIDECGFKLNPGKTVPMCMHEKQKVTGIKVNVKPNIEKDDYQELKKMIHICGKFGLASYMGRLKNRKGKFIDTPDKLRSYLSGKLNYVKQLNPEKAEKLMTKFSKIQWS
jgi:RNA-directed DNA polymerase